MGDSSSLPAEAEASWIWRDPCAATGNSEKVLVRGRGVWMRVGHEGIPTTPGGDDRAASGLLGSRLVELDVTRTACYSPMVRRTGVCCRLDAAYRLVRLEVASLDEAGHSAGPGRKCRPDGRQVVSRVNVELPRAGAELSRILSNARCSPPHAHPLRHRQREPSDG